MFSNPNARNMIIRSVGSKHGGFPIRMRKTVPAGYELMGYANDTNELRAIMFGNFRLVTIKTHN